MLISTAHKTFLWPRSLYVPAYFIHYVMHSVMSSPLPQYIVGLPSTNTCARVYRRAQVHCLLLLIIFLGPSHCVWQALSAFWSPLRLILQRHEQHTRNSKEKQSWNLKNRSVIYGIHPINTVSNSIKACWCLNRGKASCYEHRGCCSI